MFKPQQHDRCHFVIACANDIRDSSYHADIMHRFSDLTRMCSRNSRSVSYSYPTIHPITGLRDRVLQDKINRAGAGGR